MPQENPNEYQALSNQVQHLEARLMQVELHLNLVRSAAPPISWLNPQPTASSPDTHVVAPVPPVPPPPASPPPPTLPPSPLLPDLTAEKTTASDIPNAASPFPEVVSFAPNDAPASPLQIAFVPPIPISPSPVDTPSGPSAVSKGWNEIEQLIGGRWALWLGALCLFLSAASFLAYTWYALVPWMRVGLGAVGGAALLITGALLRSRTQRWYSEGLFGAGLSICYLSAWAAGPYYELLGFTASSGTLVGVALLGVALALRYDARSLSTLSAIGGFLTPILLNSGHGSSVPWTFFTYLTLLNATLLATGTFKKWGELRWLCFGATLLLVSGWSLNALPATIAATRLPAWGYWTLYWLMFLTVASWPTLAHNEEPKENDLLLFFGATSLYAPASWFWLRPALGDYPIVFPLGLAASFALGALALRRARPQVKTIRTIAAALSLLAITLSFPSQYGTRGLSIFWTLEAGTLLLLASRLQSRLFVIAGQIVLGVSVLMLVYDQALRPTPHLVFVNARALPLLIWTTVVTIIAWERQRSSISDEAKPLYPSLAALAGAFLLTQEIGQWFAWTHTPNQASWLSASLYVLGIVGLAYGLMLWRIARHISDAALLGFGLCFGCAGLLLTFGTSLLGEAENWVPLWNLRAAGFFFTALLLIGAAWHSRRDIHSNFAPNIEEAAKRSYPSLAALAGAFLFTHEIGQWFALSHFPSPTSWAVGAVYIISTVGVAYALILWRIARHLKDEALLICGMFFGGAGLLVSFGISFWGQSEWAPVWNLRAASFAISTFSLLWAIWQTRRDELNSDEQDPAHQTSPILHSLPLATSAFALAGISFELYFGLDSDKATAHLALSMLWSATSALIVSWPNPRQRDATRLFSLFVGVGALIALLIGTSLSPEKQLPVLNLRFLAFSFAVAAALWGARHLAFSGEETHKYKDVVTTLLFAAWGLGLWVLTQETWQTSLYFQGVLGTQWQRWAQMSVSLIWSLIGTLTLVGGVARHSQPFRLAALTFLAFTAGKVFLFDFSFLTGPLRVLSFGGLGLSLIFISWLYSRFVTPPAKPSS